MSKHLANAAGPIRSIPITLRIQHFDIRSTTVGNVRRVRENSNCSRIISCAAELRVQLCDCFSPATSVEASTCFNSHDTGFR